MELQWTEQLDARISSVSKHIRKAALLACRANIVVGGIQKNLASRPPGWREECGRGRSRPGDERARVQQGRNQSSGLDGRGGAVSRSGVHFGPKRGEERRECFFSGERGHVFFVTFISPSRSKIWFSRGLF